MNKEDYYQILGIDRSANDMEVKKAYKKLAMKYHPDRNANDKTAEMQFKKIGEAYEVLSNSEKRQIYDQYGHSGFGNASSSSNSTSHLTDIFSDIFGDIFGSQTSFYKDRQYSSRGSDLLHIIHTDLENAADGFEAIFKIDTFVSCKKCKSSGAKNSSSFIKCNKCNGYGQIKIQQGFINIQQICNKCSGQGSIIKEICNICYGKGRVKTKKILSTKIPAGINDNDKIRLNGEGEAAESGGISGDLYIQVKIKKHDVFTRINSNLYCELPVSFLKATLGGDLDVPSLKGKIKIKLPKETQTNKTFRLKDKGIKNLRDYNNGDLFCKVIIETPVNLNVEQMKLLKLFENSLQNENKPKEIRWITLTREFLNKIIS